MFEALGHRLIAIAVELHQGEDIGLGFKEPLYALDSTTIDLCLTLFPWADFRSTKAAVKAHTIVDLRGAIPVFVHITTGKVHDVNVLDLIHWPAGSILVVDRGYLDFARLQSLHRRQVSFVIRAKDNTRYTWATSREVDKSTGLRSDQGIVLATPKSKLAYPHRLRRVLYRDLDTDKFLVFLTNRFDLPALTIAEIYRKRWQVETFFDGSPFCTPSYVIECQGRADCCRWCAEFFCRRRPRSICRRRPCAESKARSRTHGWPAAASSGSFGAP